MVIQYFQDQAQYCGHVEGYLHRCCFPFTLPFYADRCQDLLGIKVTCHELVFRDQKTASNASEYSDFSKASICLRSVDLKDMVLNRIRNDPGSSPQCCHTNVRTRTSTTDKATVDEHSGGHLPFCQSAFVWFYGSSWWLVQVEVLMVIYSFPPSSSFCFSFSSSSPFNSH